MNAKTFSEAMGAIDNKYIDRALNYHRKRKIRLLPIAASLTILLSLCGFAYSAYIYWGVGAVERIDFDKLTKPFGTVAGEQTADEGDSGIFYEKSGLISDYTNVYADNSVCVTTDENMIPPLYFSPNYMIIFTREDEKSWALEAGEQLTLQFSLYHSQSLELEIGYILNGKYHLLSVSRGRDFDETLIAAEEGEYYFCVTNHSSANAIIENGEIH